MIRPLCFIKSILRDRKWSIKYVEHNFPSRPHYAKEEPNFAHWSVKNSASTIHQNVPSICLEFCTGLVLVINDIEIVKLAAFQIFFRVDFLREFFT